MPEGRSFRAPLNARLTLWESVLGLLLHFFDRRIEGTLSVTRSVGDRLILPRVALHALLLGAVFVGYYWLKIGRTPWA